MSKRNRTHFVVEVDGQHRELFSVVEKSRGEDQGTLRILIRHAEFYRDGSQRRRIRNQYYSVHSSPRSEGNYIHQTIDLENGPSIETPRFTLALRDGSFATIMNCLPPLLNIDRYRYNGTLNETRVIGNFSQSTGNMLWSVSVSRPGVGMEIKDNTLNYFYEDFTVFRLNVLTSYIGVLANGDGDRIHHLTGSPGIKGQPKPPAFPVKTDGDSSEEVEIMTSASFHALHLQSLGRVGMATGPVSALLIATTAPRKTRY